MSKFYQFLILLASFIAQFISEGIVISFTIYYPTLSRYFDTSQSEISLIGSFSYGCWCCIGPFAGHLVEKFGSKPVLMFAGLIGTAAMFAGAYAVQLWHIIVCFSLFALCCGLALIPSITVITHFFTCHRHLAATAATIGGASGAVCYPLLIQYLLINQTWQYCFIITAGLTLQLVLCSLILNIKSAKLIAKEVEMTSLNRFDEVDSRNVVTNQPMTAQIKTNLGLYAVHCFMWNLTCFAFLTVLPLFLDHNDHSVTEIAFAMSLCAIAIIVGRFMAALYCIRKNGDRILIYNLSTLLTAICTLLFVLKTNFAVYCSFAALYGLYLGLQTAIMVVVTLDIVKNQHVNFAFGIIMFAAGMAGLISPFVTGWLIDTLKQFDYVFVIISLPSFVCCFLMTHLHWPFKRRN